MSSTFSLLWITLSNPETHTHIPADREHPNQLFTPEVETTGRGKKGAGMKEKKNRHTAERESVCGCLYSMSVGGGKMGKTTINTPLLITLQAN